MKIDLNKLTMMGHSFGGLTALEASWEYFDEIKYCVSLDPWFYPNTDDVKNGKFTVN